MIRPFAMLHSMTDRSPPMPLRSLLSERNQYPTMITLDEAMAPWLQRSDQVHAGRMTMRDFSRASAAELRRARTR